MKQKKINVRVIRLSEIKPFGPLQDTLEKFEKKITLLEAEGKYSKQVTKTFKLLVDFGFTDGDWLFDELALNAHRDEIEMIFILGSMYAIRLNNIAQKHLNGIKMEPVHEQLAKNEGIQKHIPNVYFAE
jgi:hypothetical protein